LHHEKATECSIKRAKGGVRQVVPSVTAIKLPAGKEGQKGQNPNKTVPAGHRLWTKDSLLGCAFFVVTN
jgi:hypothetical protein